MPVWSPKSWRRRRWSPAWWRLTLGRREMRKASTLAPPKNEAERWRRMPLDEVAERTFADISVTVYKGQTELQRRLIAALSRYSEEAARATFWLIILTLVLVGLTVVLVVVAFVD